MLYNVNIICTDLIYLNHFYFYRKEIEDINIRNRNIIVQEIANILHLPVL